MKESTVKKTIIVLSVVVPLLVIVLLVLPNEARIEITAAKKLPFFHAILNGLTALFLLFGFYFIRKKKQGKHRFCMLSAFSLSCVFLISYVIYHYTEGSTPFGGEGLIRYCYFFILITHVFLATTIIPLVLFTLFRGLSKDFVAHKKIAKTTFPLWLYVALSGVAVYLFMMPYYHA